LRGGGGGTSTWSGVRKRKSNGVIDFGHVEVFNECINKWGLIELGNPTRAYSWSSNQENPILARLDKIFASAKWGGKYPLSKVTMLPKGCSDHNPLRIEFGAKPKFKESAFRFEKWWLEVEEFAEVVQKA
jgi:hypothetical protein